ncbi:MAG TPA: alpha/beta hydrolase [Oligoflexus sp.]|uniref:alpha/beta fold hydrolase n=1 Tax=Oligoflexus sp. TaxID=1971216 RepID=UPI002D59F27A|nr:alpha/beta hydrolase [Oligoflexus sp.]HYX39269.1 alpha/beta hydrolase [Oligoflexus sp.]
MPFMVRDDVEIFYEVLGTDGPWLTLVNGHTRSSRDFRLLAGNLSKQGVRCLLFDNRGAGETKNSPHFTLDDIAEDILQLWDELGIDRSIVMGLSMGGIVSQILTHKAEGRVQGLILVSTASSESSLSSAAFTPWGQTEDSVFQKLQAYFTEGFLQRNKLLVQAMAKQILQSITADHFEERAHHQRQAMRGVDTRTFLGSLHLPTLIIHGTDDRIIPVSAGEELAKLIPGAQLKKLPDVGHLVLAEYSKNLTQDVLEFLKSNGWL